MCTALCLKTDKTSCFFGRNMDLAYFFNQSPLFIAKGSMYKNFVTGEQTTINRKIIGMGTVIDDYPAMADAMNENGLGCAGLNFARYAHYEDSPAPDKKNIPPYEFILWVLSNHDTVEEVKSSISGIELVAKPINENTPVATLHWMISDKSGQSIVVEKTKDKFIVHDNPVNVMTNDPTFDWHLTNLNEYLYLKPNHHKPAVWGEKKLQGLGIGSGTLGMPGDFASVSRFVRIAYVRSHLPEIENDEEAISQFFHMLDYVAMVKGGVITEDELEDLTLYSSCMDLNNGVYYYKTHNNNRINAVNMHRCTTQDNKITVFSYLNKQDFNFQN